MVNNPQSTSQQANDPTKSAGSGVKEQAKSLASDAKEQAKSLASEAKDQAKDMANQARGHVETLVDQQSNQAADRLGSLAQALREAGNKLNENQQAGDFGQYAGRAAQQVERLSNYLREGDLRGFVRDTESFARRRPEVFLGGTLVAGLMLARFLKASSPTPETRTGYPAGARSNASQPSRGVSPGLSSSRPSAAPRPTQPAPYTSPAGV
jgi:uncharacterized protein YaaR (DUF327 family)